MRRVFVIAIFATGLTCGDKPLPTGTATPKTFFTSELTNKRFSVAEHFMASIEMQISGEPFAQLLGRNLVGYNRFSPIPDQYLDPDTGETIIDPLSFSMAVESYEYSKQPMNNTSFESGAGMSLQFAPLLNPSNVTGDQAYQIMLDRLQHLAEQSSSGGPAGKNFVVSPPPLSNPLNIYGWPGYWPVFAEFRSFDPTINPTSGATRGCTVVGGYAATSMGAQVVGDYECGYISLNLPVRDVQVEKVIEPAALGFAAWKQGLWVINYWQSMHDLAGNPIIEVADSDLPMVGVGGNSVVGKYPDPADPTGMKLLDGMQGVYLGDVPLEGWQGLTMLEELDNKAAFLLTRLTTTDGAQLGGFATVKDAIDYDYSSPLRWWPAETTVTESDTGTGPPTPGNAWKYFPQPTQLQITTGSSRLRGLAGLAGGFAEFFALTDANNHDVGGSPSCRATFDGDPFAADNGLPDGQDSPHDRALSVIKVAVVNMDRLHFDAQNKVLVDEATATTRGTTVNTVDAAYTIVGLRAALRSISSSLLLYSNDTPDAIGAPTALDAARFNGASAPLAQRMVQLIKAEADFIVDKLTAKDGSVANSYDLAAGAPDSSPTLLQTEASAIRGLLEAYLATSDERYRQTAVRIWNDLDLRFWMHDVRMWRTTAGVSDALTWTPLGFGTIQGAMRQYWKLVGNQPGNERLASEILERVQRTNKLVANGWDDANADNVVQYPDECTGAGLQMGERALTGELSRFADAGDRDHDCVQEIAVSKLPSALASEVLFKRRQ